MNKEKIAILADSCCDIPTRYHEEYHIYRIPLKVVYTDREYLDGVTITPKEVYDNLGVEIPKTSLPSGEEIISVFDQIKADGYEKVIAITLSSGLSGTFNLIHLIAADYVGLEVITWDTKSIALGSGFSAIYAARLLNEGKGLDEVMASLEKFRTKTKVYFCVSTLEYLQKGGRIGLVASILGSALNLKPIISVNDEGIYYTVAKVRGRKQSITRTIELAENYAKGKHIFVALSHGGAQEIADEIKPVLLEQLENVELFVEGQISPVLGVHTGPGCIGIIICDLS